MMLSKACDVTGIVAIACARHGCFAPNGVANLFCGEQQKNVDWALVRACQTTTVDYCQGLVLIYDIACQYIIHLKECIGDLLPAGLNVDLAIGLFHVDMRTRRYTLYCAGANSRGLFIRHNIAERVREANRLVK